MPEQIFPESHLIESYAAREVSFETCLFEFIDNSLDASARVVRVDVRTGPQSYLTISDDGEGCSDLNVMRVPGKRSELAGTVSGRFGIGGTIASIALSGMNGVQSIVSVKKGARIECSSRVSWKRIKLDNWTYPDIKRRPAPPGAVGTTISIEPLVRSPRSWRELPSKIAAHFWPALVSSPVPASVHVRFPGMKGFAPVVPPDFPKLRPGAVDTIVSVGKRQARVRCGIVPEGCPNTMPGFSYFLTGRRVIESMSDNGAGEFSVANIHATVELLDKPQRWELSDHKNRIQKGKSLYDAVHEVCRDTLMQAEEIGESIELKRFMRAVEDTVNGPDSGEPGSGSKNPPNPGPVRPPRPAPDPKPDPHRQGPGQRPRLKFTWRDLGDDSGVGRVDKKWVTLNLAKPYVAELKETRDVERTALLVMVLWNEFQSLSGAPKQQQLAFVNEELTRILSQRLAQLLANLKRNAPPQAEAAE
jgi:hypothetical protein